VKYAVVGAICLAVGAILGAGAPHPAKKWKFTTFEASYKDKSTRYGIVEGYSDLLAKTPQENILFASPTEGGWQFLIREPAE